jgi:signal transduction histidine kinase
MLPGSLIKRFDKGRLRGLLALFFVALAVPTGVLIWQAYSQLKWEAFHQYRGMAEELTRRIDLGLAERVGNAEARSFADYTFLVVEGSPGAGFVQRSPLSELPLTEDLPGVIGYFQVGTEGEFSTPLLPQGNEDPAAFGITAEEYRRRIELAQRIQAILGDNRLVRSSAPGTHEGLASAPAEIPRGLSDAEEEMDTPEYRQRSADTASRIENEAIGDRDSLARFSPEEKPASPEVVYSQSVFDELSAPEKGSDAAHAAAGLGGESSAAGPGTGERLNTLGKVADLNLDADLQRKSEAIEQSRSEDYFQADKRLDSSGRMKRREQIALPESEPAAATRTPIVNIGAMRNLRISTFESEIDPFEFRLLDSGHFVLFRKVWREGQRYIQGLLIDQRAFLGTAFDDRFRETGLAAMSNLIVAYQDDVIHTVSGARYPAYSSSSEAFDGALLYRSALSAPFDRLELIYGINGLPPGPGAAVLGWVTLVLAMVFLGGFYALYRLGLSQIDLARQQQDFVSAVSHELRTPLTSIRMYGEMLKEGWADADKQQQYYEFIHDESERLSRLISNVLQLARITRNEPQFDQKTISVIELMNQVESKISNQVERAGYSLAFRIDEDTSVVCIDIDADCFAQIIINLVDNAIKFSKDTENKRIEIGAKLTNGDRVRFSVRDFGPGIPPDQMKRIFQLFYRTESELTRETVGTGIGLAIVHQLGQAMGGKVDVVNQEPGAEFRVSFPAQRPIG